MIKTFKIKQNRAPIAPFILLVVLFSCLFLFPFLFSGLFSLSIPQKNILAAPEVQTSSAGLISRVAPGEPLPVSVKLVNFGSRNRVDVVVSYLITDTAGRTIFNSTETVAVETSASFVKVIQIPFETLPGRYTAKATIAYPDQVSPATTGFTFIVEPKIFGLFRSDFFLYGGITMVISVLMAALGHALVSRRRQGRQAPLDYSDVARDDRIFYEIISDAIMEMRQRVGDEAMLIAENINGLKIDKKTGRVMSFTDKPSKVIATLVSEYEIMLGKKVSFALRRSKSSL